MIDEICTLTYFTDILVICSGRVTRLYIQHTICTSPTHHLLEAGKTICLGTRTQQPWTLRGPPTTSSCVGRSCSRMHEEPFGTHTYPCGQIHNGTEIPWEQRGVSYSPLPFFQVHRLRKNKHFNNINT